MITIKKLILTIAACFVVALSFAQENRGQNDEIKEKAELRVTLLKQQLDLTEEQIPSVRELVTAFEYKKAASTEKPETLEMMLDEQLAGILTEEQNAKYRAMQSDGKKVD